MAAPCEEAAPNPTATTTSHDDDYGARGGEERKEDASAAEVEEPENLQCVITKV